ncbi:DUF2000 domain-containing protein [Clostridium sp. PL3]|uniref:DUF2000 domain-containing protein n=1 Tax=Clostridium thailandense TaxID=2794346 RepID=A0A949WPK6_9CLOT|nr:DUF2000 domain-containing protein [Clostridium thailandense]MBV7271416.1 DUF2000 domain-containing protein [Clostridium thailandense]
MYNENNEFLTVLDEIPTRCTIIMDSALSGGLLANAIAVISLTAGKRHPVLLGADLVDASGETHPGLIPTGIPMLCTDGDSLKELRIKAKEKGCDVVDFSVEGQKTKNYQEYLEVTCSIPAEQMQYLGIALIGSRNVINKLTKNCEMIK